VRVYHVALKPKKRKKRVPWTAAEEKFLTGLITKHGAKWANFEKAHGNHELLGRNQIAMKDKARNFMRLIVDSGKEEEFLRKYPKWAEVSIGSARRGVHDYHGENIPVRDHKRRALMKLYNDAKATADKR
jgi:hypothetical protein